MTDLFRAWSGPDIMRCGGWSVGLQAFPRRDLMTHRSDEGCMTLVAAEIEFTFGRSWQDREDGKWTWPLFRLRFRSDLKEINRRLDNMARQYGHAY